MTFSIAAAIGQVGQLVKPRGGPYTQSMLRHCCRGCFPGAAGRARHRATPSTERAGCALMASVPIAELVSGFLDAHHDTERLATRLTRVTPWVAHLSYLQELRRLGQKPVRARAPTRFREPAHTCCQPGRATSRRQERKRDGCQPRDWRRDCGGVRTIWSETTRAPGPLRKRRLECDRADGQRYPPVSCLLVPVTYC